MLEPDLIALSGIRETLLQEIVGGEGGGKGKGCIMSWIIHAFL